MEIVSRFLMVLLWKDKIRIKSLEYEQQISLIQAKRFQRKMRFYLRRLIFKSQTHYNILSTTQKKRNRTSNAFVHFFSNCKVFSLITIDESF